LFKTGITNVHATLRRNHFVAGLGWGGQLLLVYPERDLLAVFNSWNIYRKELLRLQALLLEKIVPDLALE